MFLYTSSHNGTFGGRGSLLLHSDLSSALMTRCNAKKGTLTHMYWSIQDRRVRSGVLLHQSSSAANLILKLFERPSHTVPVNTQTKARIQKTRSLNSLQMEAVALKQKISKVCHRRSGLLLLFQAAFSMDNFGWADRTLQTNAPPGEEVSEKVGIHIWKSTE